MNVEGVDGISNCTQCGKIFRNLGNGFNICQKCKELDEEEFNLVKDYIYENPFATLKNTASATGVKVMRIQSYLRNGRLMIPDNSPIFINCENCGTSIKYGRICIECAKILSKEMKKEMDIEECQIGESPKRDSWYTTVFSSGFTK